MKRWDPRNEAFFPQIAMDQDEVNRYAQGIGISFAVFQDSFHLQECTISISISSWEPILEKITPHGKA